MRNLIEKPIGIIKAEGVGPEIMAGTLTCLKEIAKSRKIKSNLLEYKGLAPVYGDFEKAYLPFKKFYKKIKASGGCILRAGIFAAIIYKLRQDFNTVYKPIYIKSMLELLDTFLFKKEIANKIDIFLIRDNCEGLLSVKEKIRN